MSAPGTVMTVTWLGAQPALGKQYTTSRTTLSENRKSSNAAVSHDHGGKCARVQIEEAVARQARRRHKRQVSELQSLTAEKRNCSSGVKKLMFAKRRRKCRPQIAAPEILIAVSVIYRR
jgi:hypothetical protein